MVGARLVRDEARALVRSQIAPSDRILITGATGWFGMTMLALLDDCPDTQLLLVASRERMIDVGGREYAVRAWDLAAVADFCPTVVLNFAFLNRSKEALLGAEAYAMANDELSRRFDEAATLPKVRAALTVSSGAAVVTPEGEGLPLGSYGLAKRAEESRALSLVGPRCVVVARAWSVSGTLVQQAHDYAFSDLVLQARTGRVAVTAPSEVWRRYCGVDDYLAVCVARMLGGWSGLIDSGGPEVELRVLARLVANRYPGATPEVVAALPTDPPRRYCSDDTSWTNACAELGFRPATLGEQVDAVQSALP